MSKEQERSDIEHGIALEEEKLHREVELKRRSNLEQPALESETRIEAKVTDHNTRLVTDHHIGQLRRPSFHDPLDMRSSKLPENRSRFSSRREHSPKRSSVERNGRVDGRVHHIRRLVVILHGRERMQMVGMLMKTVDIHGIRLRCLIARRYMDPSTGSM